MEVHRLTRLQHEFGRRYLEPRWSAVAFHRRRIHGPAGQRFGLLRSERIYATRRDEKHPSARDRGATENRFRDSFGLPGVLLRAQRHRHFAQHLHLVGMRSENEKLAGFSPDIKLPVG